MSGTVPLARRGMLSSVESFYGKTRSDLATQVGSPMRAARVFRGIYCNHAVAFDSIAGVPAAVRTGLARRFDLKLPAIAQRFAAGDGTQRYLIRLSDGETVESVRIPSPNRATFCVSSQVGCGLACAFCLTGQMGLIRDLSAAEIVSQVLILRAQTAPGLRFSIVFMGMGEPLQNYASVMQAIRILSDDCGLAVPATRITVSTAGLVPGLRRLANEEIFPNLSISLTGVTNAARDVLMPINRRYPIEEVLATVRELPSARQSRVMLECVMIRGVTDSADDAHTLSRLVSGMRLKVNLIPLNPAPEIPFERPQDAAVLRYQAILLENGVATFIRRNRGNDVSGACGQLRKKGEVQGSYAER